MVRVFIVDENPVMELGLRSLLGDHPEIEVVGDASNGGPMAGAVPAHGVDVILLSASPPNPVRIRALARHGGGARIALLTSAAEQSVLLRALAAGAHSCILHGHFEPQEVAAMVLATAYGQSFLSSTVAVCLVTWLHGNASMDTRPRLGLTPREIEIMELIRGGLSNRGIADRLIISEKTVKNHVHSIYKRLGSDGRENAIQRWNDLQSAARTNE